jgi:hypothetical protein
VAELTLDKVMLPGCAGKKTVTPSRCRPVVSYWHDSIG